MEVLPPDGFRGDRVASVDIGALARTLVETHLPVSRLQLVVHTRPPVPPTGPDTPCAASYRELLGGAAIAVEQRCWVAVRIAVDVAANELDGPHETEQALRSAIARARRTLTRAGTRPRVLDGDGLFAALATSSELSGLSPLAGQQALGGGRPRPATRERWSSWHVGDTAHACFWVSHWPPRIEPHALATLAASPAVRTATAFVIEPHGDEIGVACLVRVSADVHELGTATRRLADGARRIGVRLRRLDGDHTGGVYATAPTAAEAP
jgi:type VII secretion protein EccE